MPATLIDNINLLVNATENFSLLKGKDLSVLPCIENAYLIIEGDQIAGYGSMKNLNHKAEDFAFHINATGKIVLPSWCDSHTHLVFAANREGEFINRIRGLSYEEIALKGGGILHSAKQLNETSEDKLFTQAYDRLQDVMKLGTGAIEIKSGYGLTVEGETADVQNGTVTLRGTIKSRDDLQKLMMALQESNIKNVNNQLTVK